jgi:hypothetical protein
MPVNLLAACRWPDLQPPFDAALRDAVDFVFGRFEPIGIVATGTIIRGTAHTASDLDICVVHRAAFRQRVQRRFRGVAAEIFVNPPATIRGYFQDEHADGRPIFAHMLATGMAMYAVDDIVEVLRAEAQSWLERASPPTIEWQRARRYAIASQFEDALDVFADDPDTSSMLLGQAVFAMLELFARVRTGRVPRVKDLLRTVTGIDRSVGGLAVAFYDAKELFQQRTVAESLADRILETRGFFEWESSPEPVAVDAY